MSLAGMCIVGSLLRLGEGYLVGALALLGAAIGAAFDPFRAFLPPPLGTPIPGVSLAHWVGLPTAVLLTLAPLALFWRLGARVVGATVARPAFGGPPSRPEGLRDCAPLQLATPAVIGGVLLAIINTVQMARYSPWTAAYPLGLVASAAAGRLRPSLLSHGLPLMVLDAGVVLGAMASALARRELRLRWPRQWRQASTSLVGGVLMGWGVQLARGCNIAGLFSALPSLSISAWLFLPGLFLGAWLGSLVIRKID
jgi:uncharacterized membrane protein YedE/YeeE